MTSLGLLLLFAKIALLTFGGGYAMVPLFERELVVCHELLSSEDFANLVGLAQVTPGPLGFNAATYVGLAHGGLAGAVAASLGVVVPSLAIALVTAVFFRRAAKARWMMHLLRGIRPCVVGVIGAAVVFFAKTSVCLCWQGAAVFLAVLVVRGGFPKLHPAWSLALAAALGYVLFP